MTLAKADVCTSNLTSTARAAPGNMRQPVFRNEWHQRLTVGFFVALVVSGLNVIATWLGKRGYLWGDPIPFSDALPSLPPMFIVVFLAYVWWDYYSARARRRR
jgi:hypothetical protein